jgi:hypothetical protein
MTSTRSTTFNFTLILSGVRELTDGVCDALYEAGCSDSLPGMRDDFVFLDFSREASSLQDAVQSAIAAVEGAGIGAKVVRVETGES